MNIALTNLAILISTALMLCLAMSLSWLYFGRQRYALIWAVAAGGGALHWTLNAAARASDNNADWVMIVSGILVVIDATLVAVGSRERTGLPLRLPLFVSLAAIAIAGVLMMVLIYDNIGLRGFITNSYCAIMMVVAGGAVFPRHRVVSVPEILVFVVLLIFALLCMALAMLSLGAGRSGSGAGADVFRAVLVVGLPSAYSALGIAIMFLLATDLNEQMKALITRDPLTGVLNRRGFAHQANAAIANARRRQQPIALVMTNIDGFKSLNARRGYPFGDRVLAGFADLICTNVREEDVVGRTDGNVFSLVLIDSDADQAQDVVERVRRDLALLSIDGEADLGLSASFGIASDLSDDITMGSLGKRADDALQGARVARAHHAIAA
ncbi:GGDEF domain-containing protein [Sphingobium boeckii]|uniref:diguanylate cyclase n=1 Tax=Sphingobium boeckii TaxID=1082345 RepID=A0A7W9AK72_9SPHN|nr:GGDEF domain-containing protein [Sphingobium boeckii]MBB5687194.1 diguanylate cyclase (GGDEF)-like protein [Sphingobium boeckii]